MPEFQNQIDYSMNIFYMTNYIHSVGVWLVLLLYMYYLPINSRLIFCSFSKVDELAVSVLYFALQSKRG